MNDYDYNAGSLHYTILPTIVNWCQMLIDFRRR